MCACARARVCVEQSDGVRYGAKRWGQEWMNQMVPAVLSQGPGKCALVISRHKPPYHIIWGFTMSTRGRLGQSNKSIPISITGLQDIVFRKHTWTDLEKNNGN